MSVSFTFHRSLPWLVLSLVLLSCAFFQPGGKTTPQPEKIIPGKIIFEDNFSDPSSGWNQVSAPNGATEYADGMYRIWVNEPNLDVWARPGLDLARPGLKASVPDDVSIEVDALKVEGERNNRFGLICRLSGANNFYVFLISSDGFYGIGKVINGQFWLISSERLRPSPLIRTGSTANSLRADCVGSSLILIVNGKKLAEVQDTDLQSGDVGLFAGAYDAPGVDIRFDNFIVRDFVVSQP